MKYKWSARHNAFFPVPHLHLYAGWDLSDCIDIEPAIVAEFCGSAPFGKERVVGDNGMPAWADIHEAPTPPGEQAS